ncbi:MAG: hypothetical protein LBQ73_01040 [Tannerellaceae bacterium]|jgi:hypothetical protein|nr:hypothetical protein [Tannerellaceae bacterium]
MMKNGFVLFITLWMCSSLSSACDGDKPDTPVVEGNGNKGGTHLIPQELASIPEGYYQAANQQGTLVEFTYETYESRSYAQKSRRLTKRAIVYLPYGYAKENRYNAFYLMHGGWGNETSPLGTPGRPNSFKNVMDHAIANGEIQPLIIICPTYNNTSPDDSGNFSLALELNRNYHNELLNDLIPAVESAYSTYTQTTSPEDLMASRDHRGFGGFSMGSVATWRTFQYGLDYFRYFLPMSCGTSLDEDNIFAAAANHDPDDYFVWVITGTADFAYSYDQNRVQKMRNSPYFTESDSEQSGNFAYRVKDGYAHDGRASMEYTYNGLLWFWQGDMSPSGTTNVIGTADRIAVSLNARNQLLINNLPDGRHHLAVYSIAGSLVYSSVVDAGSPAVNMNHLGEGVYIAFVNNQAVKFVKP